LPTTIEQGFETLRRRLEITGLQESVISTRQQGIRESVSATMMVLDSFLIGSYRRNTMIAPLQEADVDIVILLAEPHFQAGPIGVLDLVRNVLKRSFPTTRDISKDGQAVTIEFSDFHVDVVPAFPWEQGSILIPDSTRNKWIMTNPKKHIEIWSYANRIHGGMLIPLTKMLKCWNREKGMPLRSFHLETLTLNVLCNIPVLDFPSSIRYVFEKTLSNIPVFSQDPSGVSGNVGDYLDTIPKIGEAVISLQNARDIAIEAERFGNIGFISQAYDKWRILFGRYFPSYGLLS